MKSILEVIDTANLGGATKSTRLQSKALSERGYRVVLVFPPGPYAAAFRDLQTIGVIPIEYPVKRPNLVHSIRFLRRTAKQYAVDAIHSHHQFADLLCAIARIGLRGVKHLTTAHVLPMYGCFRSRFTKFRVMLSTFVAYHSVDRVFALSEAVKDALVASFFLPERKVVVTLNGIDFDELDVDPENRARYRQRLPLRPSNHVVLCAGALHGRKGQEHLIRAISHIPSAQNVTCLLLGQDDGERERYGLLANQIGVAQQVHFLGYRSDIENWLLAADVYVQPSIDDPLPRALLEAMYLRVPVIVSDLPTLTAVVADGVNGLVVPARDSRSLSQAIMRLKRDTALAKRLSNAGHEFVARNCSMKAMVGRMVEEMKALGV